MSLRAAICYFSGTGNTAYVAQLACDSLSSHGAAVDIFRIEDLLAGRAAPFYPTSYDLVGIAHPVLGFDTPRLVYDFVRSLPAADEKPVFLLKTAGDYHSVNHSASHSIIKLLRRKGFRPFYDEIVAMPSNWLVAYDDRLNRQLVEAARERVEAAVQRILEGERRFTSNALPLRLLLKAVSCLEDRVGAKRFGSQLVTSAACTRCGKCVRDCPAGNIRLEEGGVRFGRSCLWCMRCIYSCPETAIHGRYLDLFILDGGYDLASIRAQPFEAIDFEAGRLLPWH